MNNVAGKAYKGGKGGGGEREDDEDFGFDALIGNMGRIASEDVKISELQNFLKNPPLTLFNLVPSADSGEVSFTANLKPYTQLFILAVDTNSVA